jgi:hypothetical protein
MLHVVCGHDACSALLLHIRRDKRVDMMPPSPPHTHTPYSSLHCQPRQVWRTNHGMDPRVLATQEPLFNDTVFRYDLMHDIFTALEADGTLVDDAMAVRIVATLGIKGPDFLTCAQPLYKYGDNVMSIAYAPAAQRMHVAWESGRGEAAWRPAACSPYVTVDLTKFW